MRSLLIAALLTSIASISFAEVKYIKGYTKRNGDYVRGHYRDTSNDGNPYNNASYLGY